MKKTILLALICVGVFACNKKDDAAPEPEIQSASVPYRKATTVNTSGANLKVDLREIADSRCPKDVVCITMGFVKMKFNVADEANQKDVEVDYKGDKRTDFKEFALGGKEYILRVSEVSPHPISSQTPKLEDYKVDLTIERK